MLVLKKFYNQNTLQVAEELLGKFLFRGVGDQIIKTMIVETEAYAGNDDKASHASKGMTNRTKTMFGEPGRAYIYLVYGMHSMLNIVTESKGRPGAVLIRALEPLDDSEANRKASFNGPGRLTKSLKINKSMNEVPVYKKTNGLWVEDGVIIDKSQIKRTERIGIDYAEEARSYKWRFYIKGNKHVSRT